MKLTRVTLTGADDSVDPRELVRLSSRFPFAEWGILFSASRQGNEPRYPSFDWVERRLLAATEGRDPLSTFHLAAHICGSLARDIFEGRNRTIFYSRRVFEMFARVQLNGFADASMSPDFNPFPALDTNPGIEFILQVNDAVSITAASRLARVRKNVAALWDQSGGLGRPSSAPPWSLFQGLRLGHAGGIGPHNVTDVLGMHAARPGDGAFWVDMESSLRGPDGGFDLRACEAVLEAAAPFVAGARPALGATR
jgi:hypothetical protein